MFDVSFPEQGPDERSLSDLSPHAGGLHHLLHHLTHGDNLEGNHPGQDTPLFVRVHSFLYFDGTKLQLKTSSRILVSQTLFQPDNASNVCLL